MYRIGQGVDFHELVIGHPFFLGGIKIDHLKGAIGHSDADVLLHALCDSLLGALSLGDIGKHFPNTSPAYKNIDSKILLTKTFVLVQQAGYRIVNMDSTICLEAPKIMDYIPRMKDAIAGILNTAINNISIKATTTEKLGFIGREEGVMAYCTVLLQKEKQ
ncbi:MAG: 2-C-methyl-D-erythritol 2,4-cyclodiphosphate synthase [Phycisphaerales bacterium]|nr:2-C-methyl-D-erythritol 2,4-cyclodiphosphate synthase [Phycisphaerales bacterium]